jgi:hypothetical protein
MAYTTIDDPSAYFQTTLYSGTGSTASVTNGGNSDLQPDWVWIKARNATRDHRLLDSTRGVQKELVSNSTSAEYTESTGFTAFQSDGFQHGGANGYGASGETYVSWQWKANGGTTTTNDASATSVGTIDSVYQANTTARFSIVTYSGSGSAGTIAHGLGVTPNWVMIKNRGSSTRGWIVYHDKSHGTPEENFTLLNTTAALADLDRMNDTAPTSTVFSVSDDTHVNNGSDTYVAYCFANVQGYSKFGSYEGNGNSNGTFIYTGFKPAYVITKPIDATGRWNVNDTARSPFNASDERININRTDAESTGTDRLDMLSNGFKIRDSGTAYNQNDSTYIYMAFAEHPFVSSKGVPTTAR